MVKDMCCRASWIALSPRISILQEKADKAIRIVHGRSWGGFRVKAKLALLGPDNIRKKFKQGGQTT